MQNLKNLLKSRLNKAERIALLGVGSEFRGDDAAGMLVARELASRIKSRKFRVFLGATAPENLTGEIRKFKPSHLLIVDAADIGKKVGSVTMLCANDIAGATFSTHRLPVKLIADYLSRAVSCDTIVLGIHPESFLFAKAPSPKVKKAAKDISQILEEVICISLQIRQT
ncbi:MAG: hydrogenase 3 maturation endopeptidase HyCI [Candidatus Omnitrophota bacterium]|jgi:hydrogenase 3 maturation protease